MSSAPELPGHVLGGICPLTPCSVGLQGAFREPLGSREPFQGNLQSHQACSLCLCVLSSVNPSGYSWAFGSVVRGEGLIAFYLPWMEMGSLPGRAPRDPEVFLHKPSLGSSLAFGNLYWKSGPMTGSLISPLF